ncbi:hypothetical protein NPIL_360841 [Nephila pilipes]|uniref:Uncharacterized protein n=1 Tax=Nephila pilipes TaxID=299642 RepID=A0A8X6Q553_NEPPI|nr:hypothetical protein NPIL_360841 [Nephila pilipes]
MIYKPDSAESIANIVFNRKHLCGFFALLHIPSLAIPIQITFLLVGAACVSKVYRRVVPGDDEAKHVQQQVRTRHDSFGEKDSRLGIDSFSSNWEESLIDSQGMVDFFAARIVIEILLR